METNKNIEPRIDIDDYLEKPYWVVDFLPRQVPPNANGQFFRIEDYLLKHPQIDAIYKKFFHIRTEWRELVDEPFTTECRADDDKLHAGEKHALCLDGIIAGVDRPQPR